MKQRYAVVVLFALIMASSMVSLTSYRATEQLVAEDMNQALSKALDEQKSDMISADTIQVFNSYLKFEALRGRAFLAIDTKKGFRPRPQVSTAKLTPMQQQLMEMLWLSPTHQLSKTEICDALWPKKPDANETLYTLIRRLKPIIEQHSDLKIEVDRGKSYGLIIR